MSNYDSWKTHDEHSDHAEAMTDAFERIIIADYDTIVADDDVKDLIISGSFGEPLKKAIFKKMLEIYNSRGDI